MSKSKENSTCHFGTFLVLSCCAKDANQRDGQSSTVRSRHPQQSSKQAINPRFNRINARPRPRNSHGLQHPPKSSQDVPSLPSSSKAYTCQVCRWPRRWVLSFPLIFPFLSPCPSSFLTLTSLAKPCAINRSNPRHHTPPPTKQTRRFRNLHFLLHRRPLPGRRNGLVDRCIVCEEDDLTVS
jgi:hypothetical protein